MPHSWPACSLVVQQLFHFFPQKNSIQNKKNISNHTQFDQSSNCKRIRAKKCRRAVISKPSSTISIDELSFDGLNSQKLITLFITTWLHNTTYPRIRTRNGLNSQKLTALFITTWLHYNISQNPNWHIGTNDVHDYVKYTQLKLPVLPGEGRAASLNCIWCCDLQKARVSISKTMAGTALVSPPDKENVPLVSHS